MVGEVGLEPTKAKPADLQSAPFAARDTPPNRPREKVGKTDARAKRQRARVWPGPFSGALYEGVDGLSQADEIEINFID